MNNKKNILRIGFSIIVVVLLFFALHAPRHASAICYPGPCGGGPTPTIAPTLNVAQAIGNTQTYLSWTNNDLAGTFTIYRSSDNVTFTAIGTTTATTYTDSSNFIPALCSGGAHFYYYVTLAVSGQTTSPASNTIAAIFMCAPSINYVATVSQTQLTVNWTDNSYNLEAGFYIYRDGVLVASSQPGTSSGAVLAFGEVAFTCGTKHTYYVAAYNGSNISANSAAVTGVTAPCPPTAGSVSVQSQTQVTASWTLNGTWVDSYQIYQNGSLVVSNPVGGSTLISGVFGGLQCGTTYGYLLRLWGGGVSTDAAVISGTTNACVSAPAAVSSPIATLVPGNPSFNSSWSGTFDGTRVYLKGPTGYSLAGDYSSTIKAVSFGGLKCPYPYVAYYVAYNNDPSVSGTDASCSSALSNAGISGPAAPTGAKCAPAVSNSVNMRFCTQQFLGN